MPLGRGVRMGALCALLACCASGCGAALAQGTAAPADVLASVLPDYPPGSIDSTARADAALARVNEARAAQEARYAQARKLCFDKFLAEQCLSEARLDNFRVTSRIRDVEREARAVTRSEELRERDQARDARNREAQAAAERKRADSARKQAERDERAAARLGKDGPEEAARRAARAQEANQRAASRAEARERKDAEARAGAAERAERARKHDEMVREALERAERRARAEEKKAAERRAAAAQAPTGR